jgi:hypothetical protein
LAHTPLREGEKTEIWGREMATLQKQMWDLNGRREWEGKRGKNQLVTCSQCTFFTLQVRGREKVFYAPSSLPTQTPMRCHHHNCQFSKSILTDKNLTETIQKGASLLSQDFLLLSPRRKTGGKWGWRSNKPLLSSATTTA